MELFTAWLEENDIELRSEDASHALAIDFHHTVTYHCDVLTAGAWPISITAAEHKVFLPPAVEAHTNLFTKFYTGRSTGRKLLWVHNLSYGMIQSHCFEKRYEFLLSFYQMLILMQVMTVFLVRQTSLEWISKVTCANRRYLVQHSKGDYSLKYRPANQYPGARLYTPHGQPHQGVFTQATFDMLNILLTVYTCIL